MINLLSMIPRFFQETVEFPEIMKAWQKGLDDLEENIAHVWGNQYIQTCDEETLSLYEKLLHIIPTAGESLNYRRKIVLNNYSMAVPFSEGYLRSRLDEMLGEDGYTLEVDSETCTAVLYIRSPVTSGFDMVYNLWLGISPAHIALSVFQNIVTDIDGDRIIAGLMESTTVNDIQQNIWNNVVRGSLYHGGIMVSIVEENI